MHFEMLSAICLNLDPSKNLSSGNGLQRITCVCTLMKHCVEQEFQVPGSNIKVSTVGQS